MAEPATLDAVPVLDDATWARLAAEEELRAAVAADVEAPVPAAPTPAAPRVRRLLVAAAAAAIALVSVVGLTAGDAEPREAPTAAPVESTLMAMAGEVVAAASQGDGEAAAVVALIAPTRPVRWTPGQEAGQQDAGAADDVATAGRGLGAVAAAGAQPTAR